MESPDPLANKIFKIAAVEEEQHLVFGLASLSIHSDGEVLTDLQGDQIEPAELENAVYDFVEKGREGDVNHSGPVVSSLIESFVVTPQKLAALLKACGHTGNVPEFNGCAAWMGWRVNDENVWKRVKNGELKAFSIEGKAERVPVGSAEAPDKEQ